MQIFDTHAHYDDAAFDEDRDALLSSMEESSVRYIVNVGASMEGAEASARFSEQWPFMYAAAGLHPDDVGVLERDESQMDRLRELALRPRCVAVGEIGLDYHWDVEPRVIQQKWFIRQLHLARELDLPVNIHSRDAAQDTFDIICREHAGTTGGIIHCYSGSSEMAREYVKRGYMLGIGGVVTFKNGRVLKRVVAETDLHSLVTETDCPYLAPSPHRGERNDSRRIALVIAEIARIKEMDPEETARILMENAKRVYRLP